MLCLDYTGSTGSLRSQMVTNGGRKEAKIKKLVLSRVASFLGGKEPNIQEPLRPHSAVMAI